MGAVGIVITERQSGRIPFSAIDRYALRYGIAGSAFDLFCALIDALDATFIEVEAEQAKERAQARG